MLGHILGLSLAKADPFTAGFQIDGAAGDTLVVTNNIAVINNATVGKNCVVKEGDGFSSFKCVGANIHAIAGSENKVLSLVDNGGEYNVTMTYNDATIAATGGAAISAAAFDLEYQLAANEIHFDNMFTEKFVWSLTGKEEWNGGEPLVNGRVWNMRITENFTKVELGYKTKSDKASYESRWIHDGDLRWSETECTNWLTIGQNCSQPQSANRKDEFSGSAYTGNIYDCYVPMNETAYDNRQFWTRIEIHKETSGISRPHAKMTGLGASKFGIDIYLPSAFDLTNGIAIDGYEGPDYWAAEKGNGGLIGTSNFESHWGHPNDSSCSNNKDSMGGLYANSVDDFIKRSDDKDANYALRYGFQLNQGTLALVWNNTTWKPGNTNSWLDIIPIWSTDFSNCAKVNDGKFCDNIDTIKWVSGHEFEEKVDSHNTPVWDEAKCSEDNVYKCTFNKTDARGPTVHAGNEEPVMPVGWKGNGTAYVKFEMANAATNSMFRQDSGHMKLAAMAETFEGTRMAGGVREGDDPEDTPNAGGTYTSYSSVYIRNCYLNDVFGYDYLYLTEAQDINCTPTPADPKTGKWLLTDADISLNMVEVLAEANFWIRRDQNYTQNDQDAEFYFGAEGDGFTLGAASYKVVGGELRNTPDWSANCVVDGTQLTCTKKVGGSFSLNVVNDVHRTHPAAAIESVGSDYVLYINSCDGFQMTNNADYGSDVMSGGGAGTSTTAAPSKPKGKSNIGVIVGSIFGVLAVGAAGGGGYYFYKKKGLGSDAPDRVTADDYKNSNVAFEPTYTAEVEIFDKDYFDDSV